ncbi:MAG: sialidase family protein [Planctomycetaceae bacterium]|nr:sialidase family protein [Planctomycetaceae bacterium]
MRSIIVLAVVSFGLSAWGAESTVISLDAATRERCLSILRKGVNSEEFWPAMHAAEALTQAGFPEETRKAIAPRVPVETDDQRRCGLARELVRAGDLAHTQVMLDILAGENPHGHTHACESLYKVWQIGDGWQLRKAMTQVDRPKTAMMAAAALTRWGNAEGLSVIRKFVAHPDGDTARISAWILARLGDASDTPALREGSKRFTEPLTKAYFDHALACLGDAEGMAVLVKNMKHTDAAVRTYACEFAPDARAVAARDNLLALLDDDILDIRIRAAQALLLLSKPPGPSPYETIVRDVFVATEKNPRYSEGSVIVLRDGRLMYATTEFIGSESDFAQARIVATESSDDGRTWSTPHVLQENIGKNNVMSVTLRRLSYPARFDAPIGFFYLVKNSKSDLNVWLRTSADDGVTFGPPVRATTDAGYHVLNNDRVTILSTGRIVVPVSSTADVGSVNRFVCSTWSSDDSGLTWKRSQNSIPYEKRGAMEPEVIERRDGTLLMHIRTQAGHIAVSESTNQGESWGPAKSWSVRAPEAPATLRVIPSTGDWLLIWNDTFVAGAGHGGKRTPLSFAISRDEGQTWSPSRSLETSTDHTYAYTSVAFHEGRLLLSYYVGDEKTGRISSRFRSLPIAELYKPVTP